MAGKKAKGYGTPISPTPGQRKLLPANGPKRLAARRKRRKR